MSDHSVAVEPSHERAPVGTAAGLPLGPRQIRWVAPPAAPWAAVLAQDDGGGTCLLVDVAELGGFWAWEVAAGDHVAAPRDLVRTPRGHVAVMPACVEPVDAFLGRRAAAGVPLDRGETVTLAVSVLRGAADVVRSLPMVRTDGAGGAAPLAGTWWLDDRGCPVLVAGGTEPLAEATDGLLAELGAAAEQDRAVALALDTVREALADPRSLAHRVEELEAGLFALAPPAPLATNVFAPMRARAAWADRVAAEAEEPPVREAWWKAFTPHVDGSLAELASHVTTAVWRRVRSDRPHRRRRPVVIASVLGALVLAGGLLWPQGDDGAGHSAAHAETVRGRPTTPAPRLDRVSTPAPVRSSHGAKAPSGERSWEAATTALLDARAACGDAACRARTQEDPSARYAGAVDLPSAARSVALLDDFGGAAVLRVHPTRSPGADQLVVIVHRDDEWLLRDVHDVAQQP